MNFLDDACMAKLKTRMSHLMAWSGKDVGRDTFEFGVFDAVAHFNLGSVAATNVFKECGIVPGKYTRESCKLRNQRRLYFAESKEKDKSKLRRKQLRGKRKSKDDKKQEEEGESYGSGKF